MATYEVNLREYWDLARKHPEMLVKYSDPASIPAGAVVICSGDNFDEGCDVLGKVQYAGQSVQLPADHPDGCEGEIFVNPYNKTRLQEADPGQVFCLVLAFLFFCVWHMCVCSVLLNFTTTPILAISKGRLVEKFRSTGAALRPQTG